MNVENILKLADAIEGHKIKRLGFNMQLWHEGATTEYPDRSGHNCKTVACVGGWAEVVFTTGDAREVLGLDEPTEWDLFYRHIDSLADATPAQAAAVLRHLAATGEVDWSIAAPTGDAK